MARWKKIQNFILTEEVTFIFDLIRKKSLFLETLLLLCVQVLSDKEIGNFPAHKAYYCIEL
ncbi:hypothetical protein BpHYR1_031356 [Brachionus plicatilis]|uniref:Uncharacterized protein n=1 Tax=Brachionus plicatilis TaxID=10195 RepID=A0A3M7S8Z8_BRAPC|nr:hypothetical protein BpHYR1_031356 [Brachionus plicatilis]